MKGEFLDFVFENPRFRCADQTLVLTHKNSRIPLQHLREQIERIKPTKHVIVFVSAPWQEKNDPNISNGFEDAHENFYFLFQKHQDSDQHILVLEDDHCFWRVFEWETRSIDRFIYKEDPDVYVLGHLSVFSDTTHFPHIKCSSTCGLHAQFIHSRILKKWCEHGIFNFRALRESRSRRSDPGSMDNQTNRHAILNCDENRVFSYARPIATQTFPMERSNRHMWEHNCSSLEIKALHMLKLHKYHHGWVCIYLHIYILNVLRWIRCMFSTIWSFCQPHRSTKSL